MASIEIKFESPHEAGSRWSLGCFGSVWLDASIREAANSTGRDVQQLGRTLAVFDHPPDLRERGDEGNGDNGDGGSDRDQHDGHDYRRALLGISGLRGTTREFRPIAGERRATALSIAAMTDFPMAPSGGGQVALTGVPTEELKQLLRHVHRNEIALPVTPASLAFVGLQHRAAELMQSLRGLDEPGTRAVLVAVLAERMRP